MITYPTMLRALFNLYQLLTWPLWALLRRARRRARWIELELHGHIEELTAAPPSGLLGMLSRLRPSTLSVAELRAIRERVESDPRAEGLLVSLSSLRAGWSTLVSLREQLEKLVAANKRVVVLLPEGATQRELLVASAASTIAAPPSASFSLLGPHASRHYVAPLLAKLGLKVEVVAQGRFKTAAEALVRDQISDAEREQSSALVAGLMSRLSAGLRKRLGAQVEALFERPLFGVDHAKHVGLVDVEAYRDQLEETLGLSDKERPSAYRAYMRATRPRRLLPLRRRPRFALVQLHGPIGDVSSARSVGLKSTSQLLRSLRERRDVAAVVLHIDSPGGSASVSDLLHREVQRLAQEKPVVAWMGNVAASGGYYLAAPAHRIVARDCTVTGSIGVIAAHVVAAELLARLGIASAVIKETPYADFASPTRPLNEDERHLLDAQSQRFYQRFLAVVAEGRKLPVERVAELAQGRVWSGQDAHAVGLVDALGGYETVVEELRVLLGAASANVDWSAPLSLTPRAEGRSMWASVTSEMPATALRFYTPLAALGITPLLELSLRNGPLLAFAASAHAWSDV